MDQVSRPVTRVVTPEPVVEGAGVHLRRSIGTRTLDHLDPFLLLDHFESDPSSFRQRYVWYNHAVFDHSARHGSHRLSSFT